MRSFLQVLIHQDKHLVLLATIAILLPNNNLQAQEADPCPYIYTNPVQIQALPHNVPCVCDSNGTICQPNELCMKLPSHDFLVDYQNGINQEPDLSQFTCFPVACDDISGNWIWLGRSNDLQDKVKPYTVLGTVQVRQRNCEAEFTVTTTPSSSPVVIKSHTFYAGMSWREVYQLYLFETRKELEAHYLSSPLDRPYNWYLFVQNFESSDPQCQYFGSFVEPGIGSLDVLTRIPDGGSAAAAKLSSLSIGDTLSWPDVSSIVPCSEGYPRQWSESNDNSPLGVVDPPTPSTLESSSFVSSVALIILFVLSAVAMWVLYKNGRGKNPLGGATMECLGRKERSTMGIEHHPDAVVELVSAS